MSVRRSVVWMMASQGSLFFLQFGGSVVLAHLLTPYEMGIYAIAAAMIGILGIVQAFGLALFVIRETQLDRELLASAFTINTLLCVLLSLATVGLSAFGGAFLHEPGVRKVMLVLAIIPLLGIFEFLPFTLLERNAEFRVIAGINLLRSLISTAVTVALALTGFSYMSIAWGGVAGSATTAAAAMVVGRRHVSFRLGLTAWRYILRFGLQQLAIQGVNAVSGRLSEFLLGRLLGLAALGLYGRAANLNNLLWFNIHIVVGRIMMVDLAERRRAGLSLREGYLRTVEVLTAVLWPSFAGLAILAGPFIHIVYGAAWLPAARPAAVLAIAGMALVALTMTWEVFVVCHESGRQARFEFIRTGVGLAFFLAGCFVNLTAVAVARVGEALFSVVLYRPHMERMTDTSWADLVGIYRRSAIATTAACAPALLLMTLFSWSANIPIPLVALAVGLGIAGWLVALRLLDHALSSEIRRFVIKGRQVVGLA